MKIICVLHVKAVLPVARVWKADKITPACTCVCVPLYCEWVHTHTALSFWNTQQRLSLHCCRGERVRVRERERDREKPVMHSKRSHLHIKRNLTAHSGGGSRDVVEAPQTERDFILTLVNFGIIGIIITEVGESIGNSLWGMPNNFCINRKWNKNHKPNTHENINTLNLCTYLIRKQVLYTFECPVHGI